MTDSRDRSLPAPIANGDHGRRRRRRRLLHGFILIIVIAVAAHSGFPVHSFSRRSIPPNNTPLGLSPPGVAAAVERKGARPAALVPAAAEAPPTVPAIVHPPVHQETATHVAEKTPADRIYALGLDQAGGPTPEATPGPQAPEPPPIFTAYMVQPGDTVSSIATRFGLKPESVLWNNMEIRDEDFVDVGQQLRIPVTDGVIHEVKLGDTASDIAARYDADLKAIESFPSNRLSSPDDIRETQLVFVPGGQMPPPPPLLLPPPPGPAGPVPPATAPADTGPVPTGPSVGSAAPPAPSAGLTWPVTGPISSYFGPDHPPGGIDIDQYSSPNAPIRAAAAGVVTFAGGNPCCSYGLYVTIAHPDGSETLYAHMSSIAVVQGQAVSQSDVIGYVGCTGYCTGNHLHFELIIDGRQVDPLLYLP